MHQCMHNHAQSAPPEIPTCPNSAPTSRGHATATSSHTIPTLCYIPCMGLVHGLLIGVRTRQSAALAIIPAYCCPRPMQHTGAAWNDRNTIIPSYQVPLPAGDLLDLTAFCSQSIKDLFRDQRAERIPRIPQLSVARTAQSRDGPGHIYSKCFAVVDTITFGRLGRYRSSYSAVYTLLLFSSVCLSPVRSLGCPAPCATRTVNRYR